MCVTTPKIFFALRAKKYKDAPKNGTVKIKNLKKHGENSAENKNQFQVVFYFQLFFFSEK